MILGDLMKPAMDSLVQQMEGEIHAVLDELIPDWTLLDVKNRCVIQRIHNSPIETLIIDGRPVLEMYPLAFSEPMLRAGSYTMTVTRKIRRLPSAVPPLPQPAEQKP